MSQPTPAHHDATISMTPFYTPIPTLPFLCFGPCAPVSTLLSPYYRFHTKTTSYSLSLFHWSWKKEVNKLWEEIKNNRKKKWSQPSPAHYAATVPTKPSPHSNPNAPVPMLPSPNSHQNAPFPKLPSPSFHPQAPFTFSNPNTPVPTVPSPCAGPHVWYHNPDAASILMLLQNLYWFIYSVEQQKCEWTYSFSDELKKQDIQSETKNKYFKKSIIPDVAFLSLLLWCRHLDPPSWRCCSDAAVLMPMSWSCHSDASALVHLLWCLCSDAAPLKPPPETAT